MSKPIWVAGFVGALALAASVLALSTWRDANEERDSLWAAYQRKLATSSRIEGVLAVWTPTRLRWRRYAFDLSGQGVWKVAGERYSWTSDGATVTTLSSNGEVLSQRRPRRNPHFFPLFGLGAFKGRATRMTPVALRWATLFGKECLVFTLQLSLSEQLDDLPRLLSDRRYFERLFFSYDLYVDAGTLTPMLYQMQSLDGITMMGWYSSILVQ